MARPIALLSINTAWNVYNFRRGLIAALREAGYDVVVVSPVDDFVAKLEALGCRHRPVPLAGDTTSVLADLRLLLAYWRLFRAERPALYLGYTIKPNVYGTIAARLCGVPAVNNVSGLGTAFIRETWLTRVVTVLYRLAFRGSHTVFFQNGDDRGHFVERRIVDGTKTRVLPGSGIDLAHYLPVPLPSEQHREIEDRALPLAMSSGCARARPTAEQACPQDGRRQGTARGSARSRPESLSEEGRAHLPRVGRPADRPKSESQSDEVSGHPLGTPVFVLVARLLRDKGVGEFVEAARIVLRQRPGVRFQLLGFLDVENRTAVDRGSVERWVDEGVVEYLGATQDVRPFIAAADCVVLPSYREGTPKSLLEGAAMGRPLIATDVPGCREVVEDGVNGFLCRVRDAADLAEKMLEVIDLPPVERARMGRAGRAKVERQFDEKIVIDHYLEVIAEMPARVTASPREVIAGILVPATAPSQEELPPADRVARPGGTSLKSALPGSLTTTVDDLLAAALKGEAAPWPAGPAASVDAVLARIRYHGIAPLLHERPGAIADWPGAMHRAVRDLAVQAAMWELGHQQVLVRLLDGLAARGVQALLLKGTALAYGLYANPACRVRADTDLLVAPADLGSCRAVLAALGFRRAPDRGEATTHQEGWSIGAAGGVWHDIDLHRRLSNSELLSGLLTFEEIWAARQSLPLLCRSAAGLGRVHALLLACLHRAIHRTSPYYCDGSAHYGGDRLIWLHDIHLLAGDMVDDDWRAFTGLARQKGLAEICREGLELTMARLGTACDDEVVAGLCATGRTEPAAAYVASRRLAQIVRDFRAVPDVKSRWLFLREMALPPATYVRMLYRHANWQWLPWLYTRHVVDGLRRRR